MAETKVEAFRKLTKERIMAEEAFGLLEELKRLLRTHNVLFFEIGKKLKQLKEKELYRSLGEGGYDTWLSFLASGELGIASSTAEAYIQLYEVYIVKYKMEYDEVAQIPYDKLRMALPAVRGAKDRAEVEEWVSKAKELSRKDLLIELGRYTEAGDPKVRTIIVRIHEKCGRYILPEGLEVCDCEVKQ